MFFHQLTKFAACLIALGFLTSIYADDAETAKPREVEAGDLKLMVPASWKQQQPSNNLRLAQFLVPAPNDKLEAAELVISGPFGGSVDANVERWLAQFAPEGREVTMKEGESSQGKYVLVDMTGTYNRSIGPPIRRQTEAVENFRVINIMVTTTNGRGGNYFLKLTGPKETIEPVAEDLRKTIGAESSKEKDFAL